MSTTTEEIRSKEEVTKTELEIAGCLRRLFRHRHILRSRNIAWFQKIVDHSSSIQKVINHFLLNLIIDESLGVVYLQERDSELEERLGFQIGRKKRLDAYSSLLLVQLRHERLQFYMSPEETEVPIVKIEQLREYLRNFDDQEIDARFERSFQLAIRTLKDLQVLEETSQDSKRYEITSVCDLLLPLDEIQVYKQKIESYFMQRGQERFDEGEGENRDH